MKQIYLAYEKDCNLPVLQAVYRDISHICIQLEGSPAIDCIDHSVHHLHKIKQACVTPLNSPMRCARNDGAMMTGLRAKLCCCVRFCEMHASAFLAI